MTARHESAGPTTLVLGAAELSLLLERVGRDRIMDLMIERLGARTREHDADTVAVRARDGFRYDKPDLGLVEWMPTHEAGGPVVVKMVGYHPTNPVQRALPSVIATSSMWDTETGHLVAIADATLLTALRTGAASGLATELMAIDGPVDVGLVGLGAQAVTQLHAITRVREIRSVVGLDADPDVAESFAGRVRFLGLDVEILPVESAATIASDVDVLCTCTSVDIGDGPVIGDVPTRPGLHVNAVGADFPGKVELPGGLVERALVVPDTVEQCLVEGECQQLERAAVGPELYEVAQQRDGTEAFRRRLTVFDSTGWAVEDDVALRLAIELARRHDVGIEIEIERLPADPYDPYGAASGTRRA